MMDDKRGRGRRGEGEVTSREQTTTGRKTTREYRGRQQTESKLLKKLSIFT